MRYSKFIDASQLDFLVLLEKTNTHFQQSVHLCLVYPIFCEPKRLNFLVML